LNDSVRKALKRITKLIAKKKISGEGWRKIQSRINTFKSLLRATSWAVFNGKKEEYKKLMVKEYLAKATGIETKIKEVLDVYSDEELIKYCYYIALFINQIDRRLLKNEIIPASEKVYSIFEEHTEWINKGKRNPELGNMVMITTNQHQLMMDYKIMFKEKDASQIVPLIERLQSNYPNETIESLSTDKGFYSKTNFESCLAAGIKKTIMPKKGKCNKEEYAREHEEEFIKLRHKHSAVESNINMLEHHGLNRCMDKGKSNFERCISLSVLAYNLHIIGNELVRQMKIKEQKERQKSFKKAA
jgi:hypothetical protein